MILGLLCKTKVNDKLEPNNLNCVLNRFLNDSETSSNWATMVVQVIM
jgi:hypothetical protein